MDALLGGSRGGRVESRPTLAALLNARIARVRRGSSGRFVSYGRRVSSEATQAYAADISAQAQGRRYDRCARPSTTFAPGATDDGSRTSTSRLANRRKEVEALVTRGQPRHQRQLHPVGADAHPARRRRSGCAARHPLGVPRVPGPYEARRPSLHPACPKCRGGARRRSRSECLPRAPRCRGLRHGRRRRARPASRTLRRSNTVMFLIPMRSSANSCPSIERLRAGLPLKETSA